MTKIYEFKEHSLTISGEKPDLIYLAKLLAEAEGTVGDLRYQIEYAFDIDGIRSMDEKAECAVPAAEPSARGDEPTPINGWPAKYVVVYSEEPAGPPLRHIVTFHVEPGTEFDLRKFKKWYYMHYFKLPRDHFRVCDTMAEATAFAGNMKSQKEKETI